MTVYKFYFSLHKEKMELIPVEDYSELQKQICEARLQEPPLTYH